MTKIDQTQGRTGVSERAAVAEQGESLKAEGPQQQSGAAGGADFVSKAARTAGQIVGGVREMVGPSTVDGAIDAVGRHKGKIALVAGAIYAPGVALLAGAAAAGRTVHNGLEGKFAGKSLSEAVELQADDFRQLKAGAVAETQKTFSVLKKAFGFGDAKADKKD